MGNPSQPDLWHDSLEDALRSVVEALGGPKRVAGDLWPSKSITEGARHLNHCLDSSRAEKLALDEVVWILKAGAAADVHVGMHWLAESCGYEMPKRINPDSERDRLMREYIRSVEAQQALVRRLEALHG
jgi:hypothetical protein